VKGGATVLPFWATALLGFLYVARATRFLNSDYLAGGLRAAIAERYGEGKLFYLVTCPWCASIWVGVPVAIAAVFTPGGPLWWNQLYAAGALWFGYSWLYGLAAINLDDE
jgi:hypothetical protein